MIDFRILSPMEKVFLDTAPAADARQTRFEGFQNECVSFQAAVMSDDAPARLPVMLRAQSPLGSRVRVRSVRSVPVTLATLPGADDNYLRKTPGLYPDLLSDRLRTHLQAGLWHAFWMEVTPEGAAAGNYEIQLQLLHADTGEVLSQASACVRILPGFLPEQMLRRTNWFHSDCLAQYYRVPVFSAEHWQLIERFMAVAARRGVNMILTPLFTPPLDTAVGGERPTVQLVGVRQSPEGWQFDFSLLRRWVAAARRAGMEYFEMSHLFTQWGALHAPKIMADTDAGPVRVFGWETAACSPEYAGFLRALLPQLMDELRALGIADHTYFHISDEPCESMLEDYAAARALVAPYVDGCPIIDALSSLKFYASGIVKKPIPGINHLQEFVDAGVPGLWTYYCVSQYKAVSNLFMAMPAARTRMLGAQLYKYDIEGFLQWGYNFYNSQYSLYPIDPYAVTDADGVFPAALAFQVYPGANGEPEESIRLLLCHMAMQDLRALRWLESLTSRAHVLSLLSDCAGGPLTLVDYPRSADFFARLRAAVNREILERKGLAFHS